MADTDASSPLAATDRTSDDPRRDGPPLAEGTRIGRYIVLHRVGAGASGVVYAAHDPELDRRVALKLLVDDDPAERLGPGASPRRDRRLLREAQALARVHHPNVVHVHDVGVWNDRVFLAMEFATGGTLREWLAAAPRPWREIVGVFRDAGEGLAAAHAAGLVHRDFKPDNVLLLEDGRAAVTDFGLARSQAQQLASCPDVRVIATTTGHDETSARASRSGGLDTLTATGAIAGTPAYMAPEQFDGAAPDARSDQFSYCVALFEALHGRRPFAAGTLEGLLAAIDEGPATASVTLPRYLRQALARGLAAQPELRHTDMRALLAAIRGPRRRGALTLGTAGVGVAAAVWLAARPEPVTPRATYCDDIAAKLDGIWDAPARDALLVRFEATGLAYARDVALRVTAGFDRYAAAWIDAQTATCRAGLDGGEAAVVDARTTCLARQREQFAALVSAMGRGDADTVAQSVDAAMGLPPVAVCEGARPGRSALAPPPEATREGVAAARSSMRESTALRILGRNADARAQAELAFAAARATEYAPVIAEAKCELAESLVAAGDLDRAEPLLHEAFSDALAAGHDRVVANAAREIAFVELSRMSDPAIIERWARTGLGALESLGEPELDLRAELMDFLGTAQRRAGDTEAGLATLREVLAMREAYRGPDHYTVAQSLSSLGLALARIGDFEASIEHIERARRILRDTYGEQHPHYGAMLQNLATTHLVHGSYAAALDLYAESHRLLAASLGERHPTVAVLAYNVATNLLMLERYDDAERALREAAAIEDPLHGAESLQATSRLALLAEIHLRAGRLEQGEALVRRAIEVLARVAPTDRRRRLNFDSQLGWALLLQRRFVEAAPLLDRTLAAQAEVVGDPSVEVAETSGRLAMVELARGEPARARALIDRSVAQYEQTDPDPHQHAEAWFRRAQILAEQGERGAAVVLARRAQAFYAARGDQPSRAATVDTWLASHGAPAPDP